MAVADVERPGGAGLGDRRARRRQHDLRLHAGADLPHAARAVEHRPHVAERRRGPAGRGRRHGGRRGRRGRGGSTSTAPSCATTPSSPIRASGRGSRARGDMPPAVAAVAGPGREPPAPGPVSHSASRTRRHEHGALELETIEVQARFDGDAVSGLAGRAARPRQGAHRGLHDRRQRRRSRATSTETGFPVVRRVVRAPERWQRIVDLAAGHGDRPPGRSPTRRR